MDDSPIRSQLLEQLRHEIAERQRHGAIAGAVLSSGWPRLDAVLPLGGVRRGSLIALRGNGSLSVVAGTLAAMARTAGSVALIDTDGNWYPPALAAWGLAANRLVVARVTGEAEALWAADQALRSGAIGAVGWQHRRLRPTDWRRLQLAAEAGGAVGLLIGASIGAAELELHVEPRLSTESRRLRVTVVKCRGGAAGRSVELSIADGEEMKREGA